jgi:pimeloyl-ACP methyl ester carboxylesterase
MPTVTIPGKDITSEQIRAALRDGLDDRYDVLPGMRMTRPPGSPRAAGPDEIMVGKGPTPMVRAQVTIIRRPGRTDIRITPGGVAGDLLMNTFAIARKIRRVLLDAPAIGHKGPMLDKERSPMRRKEPAMSQPLESRRLETRLGPLAWQSSGQGPSLVFFAGALANHDLWRDVVALLEDRYRCITIDLPLGAHPWPLDEGADRSATSLARLLLDCVELLDIDDATMIGNDTAGGLLLLSLASGHEALNRIGRLVLTNCETYDHFPPDALKAAARMCRLVPWLATEGIRIQARRQLRSPQAQRKGISAVAATHVDDERMASFAGPGQRDRRVIGDFVALLASCRPELLLTAAREIPGFDRPVLLVWGDDDSRFFPLAHAERLAAGFPHATLVPVPGARTWVPIDNPSAVADAIAGFVPAQVA